MYLLCGGFLVGYLTMYCFLLWQAVSADFRVKFDVVTTAGPGSFIFKVHEDWAPLGAAHFRKLVEKGHYDDTRFFRVIPSFMVQFGISGDPIVSAVASKDTIKDEPVKKNNKVSR